MPTICSTKRLCAFARSAPMEEAPRVKRVRVTAAAHAGGGGGREDRLSGLPEGVLHRIMSFLDSRQAVRTCTLSRPWRSIWRAVPRVDADFYDFTLNWTSDKDEVDETSVAKDEAVFSRFVNRLLERRDPTATIRTFFVRCCRFDGGSAEGNRWISYALQKKAQVLEVAVLLHALELDHSVFTSRYLRTIDFNNIVMGQGFFKQLEMGCPELEELLLDKCVVVDDEIFSETLKVLTIDATHFSDDNNTCISSPSITSLALRNFMSGKPVLNDMASVVTASVLLYYVEDDDFDANDLGHCLWSLSDVENLDFSYGGKKLTIENSLQWCPKFSNLVSLTLGPWCLDANLYGLIVFLQNSPMLGKLILELATYHRGRLERIIGELEEDHLHVSTLQVSKSYAWRMIPCPRTWLTSLLIVECLLLIFVSNTGARVKMSSALFSDLRTYETSKEHALTYNSIQRSLFRLHSLISIESEST